MSYNTNKSFIIEFSNISLFILDLACRPRQDHVQQVCRHVSVRRLLEGLDGHDTFEKLRRPHDTSRLHGRRPSHVAGHKTQSQSARAGTSSEASQQDQRIRILSDGVLREVGVFKSHQRLISCRLNSLSDVCFL